MCETKVCRTCSQPKSLDQYSKCSTKSNAYRLDCKVCRRVMENLKNPPHTSRRSLLGEPYCSRCKTLKTWDDFYPKKGKIGYYQSICKSCKSAIQKTPRAKELTRLRRDRNRILYALNYIKGRALKKGLEFSIEERDVIIPTLCPLLGVPMIPLTPYAPSIDRIDNSKGYIPGNIIVISRLANTMKNSASLEQLKTFCENSLLVYNPYFSNS